MKIELDVQSFETPDGITREYVTLRAYEELIGELGALRKDVKELRKNKALLDSEVNEIARMREDRGDMKESIDAIAIFLRENYKREISLGQHKGCSFSDVVIRYMGRERGRIRIMLTNLIWGIFNR